MSKANMLLIAFLGALGIASAQEAGYMSYCSVSGVQDDRYLHARCSNGQYYYQPGSMIPRKKFHNEVLDLGLCFGNNNGQMVFEPQ
jgi:hypothetical protein